MTYSIAKLRGEFGELPGSRTAIGMLLDLADAVADVCETVCSSPGACEGMFHAPDCAACQAWDRFQAAARRVTR